MNSRIAIAMYKPHDGEEQALLELVRAHLPVLQGLELATKREQIICRSEDGTVLEIFEWVNEQSSSQAHQHPQVAKIWEQMGQIADFSTMGELPEKSRPFPHFFPV